MRNEGQVLDRIHGASPLGEAFGSVIARHGDDDRCDGRDRIDQLVSTDSVTGRPTCVRCDVLKYETRSEELSPQSLRSASREISRMRYGYPGPQVLAYDLEPARLTGGKMQAGANLKANAVLSRVSCPRKVGTRVKQTGAWPRDS